MNTTGTKIFSKLAFILLGFLFSHLNGFAQQPNQVIDISREFKKIDQYNKYIDEANSYHYESGKRTWKGIGLFLTGLSGAAGSVVLFKNKNENVKNYGGPALAGLSAVAILSAFDSDGSRGNKYEAVRNAEALFKTIPKRKLP